jgi:tetracycline repressor-like protein
MLEAARRELDSPGAAARRIAGIMLALHRTMRDQMTDEARAHEIGKIAVDEIWPPIVDYLHKCAAMLAEAIAEGQAAGEFGPGDPKDLGWRTLHACVIIHDPTMIAQCPAIRPEAGPEHAIGFALRALANLRPPAPIPET